MLPIMVYTPVTGLCQPVSELTEHGPTDDYTSLVGDFPSVSISNDLVYV